MRATSALIALAALASAQQFKFEVTSIKPAPPQAPGHTSTNISVSTSGDGRKGTLRYSNVNVKQVLEIAFKVQPYQIEGGPNWLTSERFDISAVIPERVPDSQIELMLQNLLAQRFALAVHRETRQLPIYVLGVGKNGSLMKAAESGKNDISSNSNRTRFSLNAKATMSRLAEFLSEQLGRPVVDETGLSGSYEMALEWTPEGVDQPAADSPPSLFTALQERLGLKLESRRGPVEIIVIDRLEKPTPN